MNEKRIFNYLKQLKEEGKIKDYGFETFQYWDNIPYIELEKANCLMFLCETYNANGALSIKTIDKFKDYKRVINRIIDNQKILEEYYINNYGILKFTISYLNATK